ncbi:MAG: pitrilysin family protein [Thermoanaerobaculia bacterium]|jgi:predicted Zn-dependent peptidase
MRKTLMVMALATLLLSTAPAMFAQDIASFEKRIKVETLDNGLTLIVMERPEAPVFSFFIHVDAGSSQELAGQSGLAHMFEHMAFKGTDVIGTTNYAEEKKALEKVESTYRAYELERRKLAGRDDTKVAALEKAWKDSIAEADKFVVKNEFGEIVDREGGVGLNAFTSNDETGYFYSFPANRIEVWAYLESERFLKPVMREFYKERDVVFEERRMRIESNPIGRLVEQFLAAAFTAHPYGRSGVGWPSDLSSYSASDAKLFFDQHYVPSNMVVAVVGDVKAAEVSALVKTYFGRIPKSPKPEPIRTVEPQQNSERTVVIKDPAQPFYIEGYHRPSTFDKDDAVYAVISDLMTSGRTSRLYRSLVRDKKIAAAAAGFSGFPGEKYPNLFAFYAVPTPGHTPAEMQAAIREDIEKLKTADVTADDLNMVKTRAKANLIRGLANNQGLAIQLATAQDRFGDWREVFRQVDAIDKVTAADVRRVANATFVESNRTVGIVESTKMATAPAGGQE